MSGPTLRELPPALERRDEIAGRLRGRRPAVFLDYDGTLTPIVDDPGEARLAPEVREAIERLASLCPVAVVSGRDLDDVRGRVGLDGIHYAGSHGLDLLEPGGERHARAGGHGPALDRAGDRLERELRRIPGAELERKRFALAVHYRRLEEPDDATRLEEAVDRVAAGEDGLRKTGGKKIFELRPDVDWDKGRAILWLLEILGLSGEKVLPFYLGDDLTDEDGFRALEDRGIGIVVRGEDDDRTTAADYALRDTGEVRAFLDLLAGLLEERRATG